MFEIKHRDGMARIGEFKTKHGVVETPNIMPVINPNVELILPRELRSKFGAQVLITNSYVILKTESLKSQASELGLHELLNFDGAIMTDSGTFQAHVYGDIDVEPESIVDFQMEIGSDIITILDMFTEPTDGKMVVEGKVKTTIERAREAMKRVMEEGRHLALPVQGGVFSDIREHCASELAQMDGTFFPIGGVVPLLENYRFRDLVKVILASKRGLGPRGPVHLFGAGHPMIYPMAVLLGCDLFDSSSYAKYARRGDMMYNHGTRNIDDVEHLACLCPVCSSHTVEELRQSEDRVKKIAEHNLWVSYNEIESIKQAIREESLWEMVETRARTHPYMLNALSAITDKWSIMEPYEPKSRRGALYYTGTSSLGRPVVKRLLEWIKDTYKPPSDGPTILFRVTQERKPYSRYLKEELNSLLLDYPVNLMVETPLGPVPLELDEVYPISQSIFPPSMKTISEEINTDEILEWEGKETLDSLTKGKGMTLNEMKLRTVADYQFYSGAGALFSQGELEFKLNRMGSIKNVLLNGEHVLSMRHYDGLFTLKPAGARSMHQASDFPVMRVQVTDDSALYNREGKNVFAGFITDLWEPIRPGDEVLIVDDDDSLVALGRSILNSQEMKVFKKGIAVRTREGFSD